ncbi:MAG: hypothetical protein IMY71_15550 [Bacteroidetes bacterium]|nr:hypothetical protein [Bacteroidota bacterium]
MKKLILIVSIMLLTTVTVIAQKWIVKSYLDDFGDPTNNIYVTQLVTGSYMGKVRVVIDIDLPISLQKYFGVQVFNLYGKLDFLNIPRNVGPDPHEGSLYFRYKVHGKEHSLVINNFDFFNCTFYIPRSALAHALLDSSKPIKYIIT